LKCVRLSYSVISGDITVSNHCDFDFSSWRLVHCTRFSRFDDGFESIYFCFEEFFFQTTRNRNMTNFAIIFGTSYSKLEVRYTISTEPDLVLHVYHNCRYYFFFHQELKTYLFNFLQMEKIRLVFISLSFYFYTR